MDIDSLSETQTVEAVDDVHLAQMSVCNKMSIQHFRIEPGAVVPEHEHHHEQAGFIYEGELVFLVDGEELEVGAGDSYTIPGGEPHGVENRGSAPVLGVDIFSPPRANPDWME